MVNEETEPGGHAEQAAGHRGPPGHQELKQWTKEERAKQKAEWRGPAGPGTRDRFGRLPNWISHAGIIRTLTMAEARLYLLLCQAASNGNQSHRGISDGECYPSILTLSQWSGLHRSSVITALKSLEQKGVIKRQMVIWSKTLKRVYQVILNEPAESREQVDGPSPDGEGVAWGRP